MTEYKVTFIGEDGKTMTVNCSEDTYILEAAEESGLDLHVLHVQVWLYKVLLVKMIKLF